MNSIYLSGSIEFSLDAYSWRNAFCKELSSEFSIIAPKEKKPPFKKKEERYKRWVHSTFVRPDIGDVLHAKYFFVKIDKAVLLGAGTISEVCFASFYKKHMVYMLSDGLTEKDLPGWVLGCLYKAKQVKSIDEAFKYYKSLKGK